MLDWQQLTPQLRQAIDAVFRFLKARRREEAAIAFATLLFWLGYKFASWLPAELAEFLKPWRVVLLVQILLWLAGAALLAYGIVRIYRLVSVPDLPPEKNRPSAIKGPMAFTEGDGALFRKLGRESDLQKLLGLILDNQALMVVVRGASGAGKTSLLRAGLTHILADQPVMVHYWEAVPTESDKMLLRAIRETWPEDVAKPAALDDLVNPADELGRQSHVIVLDQFEQLRGSKTIFRLLTQLARKAKPPHRITWVIAFRREFSADWLDFVSPEQERGFRPPQDVSLRLFTAEQAREVIGQLVSESNLSIEQSVVDNLVEAATVESEVSPVDIGIGLLALAELHERQSGKTITIRDYQFAGGAEGLLTQYINRCLELFANEDRETILKAMLALRDPDTHQRLAEGLTADELAQEAGAEARRLKPQLDRLTHRDARLLETVPATDDAAAARYRLPHERLIPALYRLTGKLLADVDQARLKFQNAFQAWKNNDKRSHYLLKAKELRLVEHYETQIPWGNDEQEKKGFLYRSQRRRTIIKGAAVAAVIALMVISWASYFQYQRYEGKRYLRESGYPSELYVWQHQLKKLELTEPLDLERFTWLSSQSIEELSLKAASSSNSLAGLASLSKCSSLKNLTLDLSESQVSNLEPLTELSELTQLTLNLSNSGGRVFGQPKNGGQVSNLEPLTIMRGLTRLTLNLNDSQVSSLEPLAKLSRLTQLTLDLRNSQVSSLEPLAKLSRLTHLNLTFSHGFNSSQAGSLEPLAKLNGLTQLTLDLSGSEVSSLEPLTKLSGLTQLTLDLNNQVSSLEPLAKMNRLMQLTLDLSISQVSSLEPLAKLSGLTQLTLIASSEVSSLEPLAKLSGLTQLTLDLNRSKVSSLEPLTKLSRLAQLALSLVRNYWLSGEIGLEPLTKLSGLTQLALNISHGQMSNSELLTKLKPLTHLILTFDDWLGVRSQVSSVEPLAKLGGLTQLTLNLSGSKAGSLDPLTKLGGLTQLTLDIGGTSVNNVEPLTQLSGLTNLNFDLSGSKVSNVDPLAKLSGLMQLTLDLSGSEVNTVEPLTNLSGLTQLTLDFNGGRLVVMSMLVFQEPEVRTSQVHSLMPLAKLGRLQTLSIESATRAQRMSLRKLPASLVELKF